MLLTAATSGIFLMASGFISASHEQGFPVWPLGKPGHCLVLCCGLLSGYSEVLWGLRSSLPGQVGAAYLGGSSG